MSTWIRVARYQLTDRQLYVLLLPGPALIFLLNLALAVTGVGARQGAGSFLIVLSFNFLLTGARSITRQLPFALALGVSRRAFYAGTALLAGAIAAVYGLGVTVLQLIERATGGWGLKVHYFRVPYLLAGPWYLSWLASFAGLTLLLTWGMWLAIIYRRWNLPGALAFIAAQVLALLVVVVITGRTHGWHGFGHFFTTLTIGGLTGLLAALAVAMLAGGYATMRRVTV
jgi:hypothetical protein